MTAVLCCIVIGVALYFCVNNVCETILEIHNKDSLRSSDAFDMQAALDDEAQKEQVPTFDDVLRNVNNMLGGDDDE